MTQKQNKNLGRRARIYCLLVAIMFALGLAPVVLNFVVDPYGMNGLVNLNLVKQKISEKAHYPLWKIIHYPHQRTDIVVLGDSRARALRDKYWHELGLEGAYNFAYGGATLYEIYDTFNYIKQRSDLKALVIGMQLRSFDSDHKGGLNRVPEAIRLTDNPLQYYSNWFVSRIGIKHLKQKFRDMIDQLARVEISLLTSAMAGHMPLNGQGVTQGAGHADDCHDCRIPTIVTPADQKSLAVQPDYHFADDLGIWRDLWPAIYSKQELTGKFEKQVRKNAHATWRSFNFSEAFWAYLVEISNWCKQNNVALVFVIPPTIVEMQARITDFGYGDLNHKFRADLSKLGTVVDFDFDSPLTREISRFKDAYHFDSKVARQIVGEVAQIISRDKNTTAKARKRREDIVCPIHASDISSQIAGASLQVLEGRSCRIWRTTNE